MAPANSASMAAGPALKACVSSVTFGPSFSAKMPLLHADERGGVGDVGEEAEPERHRLAAGRRRRVARRSAGRRSLADPEESSPPQARGQQAEQAEEGDEDERRPLVRSSAKRAIEASRGRTARLEGRKVVPDY